MTGEKPYLEAVVAASDSDALERRTAVSVLCPHCQSQAIRRSMRRGMLETAILWLIPVRPFRCKDCDHRFYSRTRRIRFNRKVLRRASLGTRFSNPGRA